MQYNYFINDNFFNFKFSSIPAVEIREQLKQLGFRWYKPAGVWYSKTEQNALKMLEYLKLANIEGTATTEGTANTTEQEQPKKSLFERMQVYDYSSIDNQLLDNNGQPLTRFSCSMNKLLAKECKKYLTAYFSDIKLSLSITSDYNSINTHITGSIFDINSDILEDIQYYCKIWLNGFNYDNSDPYTDYFDVGFYGNYFKIDYHYKQAETADLQAIENEYNSMKQADEKQKAEQRKKEYEEQQKAEAIEREKAEKIRKENDKKLDKIKLSCKINDLTKQNSYIFTNCIENIGKETMDDSLDYIKEHGSERKQIDMQIIRELFLENEEQLDLLFNYYCMSDMWIYNGKFGGSATFDNRVNDINDYYKLTKEQQKDIKFYACNCIAVYVKNDLKLIVNCEGYNYARYLAFTTESSEKMSFKDYEEQETKAAETKQDFYIPEPLDKQLDNALEAGTLKQNQIITVISEDNWIGMAHAKVWKYNRYEKTKYAQYDNAIAFYGTPKAEKKFKSGIYYTYFYSSPKVVILDGEHKIPEKVEYETISNDNGFISKTCVLGADANYWKRLKAWLKEENITAIVDTVAA